MNKLLTTMISATLLAVPFSIHATELHFDDAFRFNDANNQEFTLSSSDTNVSLGDMYRYEDTSAYDIEQSNSPAKNFDISLDDMYRYIDSEVYTQNPTHPDSDIIVRSSTF